MGVNYLTDSTGAIALTPVYFSGNIVVEAYDDWGIILDTIDQNEVYVTIISDTMGLALTQANMSSMA